LFTPALSSVLACRRCARAKTLAYELHTDQRTG
jgi:hypothetical protein